MTDPYRTGDARTGDAGTDPHTETQAEDFVSGKDGPGGVHGEPAIRQLDSMIENVANYAAPVLREIAARAAELAAQAGQAAGPIAHRAADKTEQVGGRLATKGREVASDLRRDGAGSGGATGTAQGGTGYEDHPQS